MTFFDQIKEETLKTKQVLITLVICKYLKFCTFTHIENDFGIHVEQN